MDPHIKFCMEAPGSDGSIPFLDTKCSPNFNSNIHTSVFRNPSTLIATWIGISTIQFQPKTVIQALMYRAKNVCSTLEILAKEMNYSETTTQIGSSKN